MANTIHVNSRIRVELPHVDVLPDGTEEPFDPTGATIRIIRPDGSIFEDDTLVVTDTEEGEAYWEGVVDAVGTWTIQGTSDNYLSKPVTFRVHRNP